MSNIVSMKEQRQQAAVFFTHERLIFALVITNLISLFLLLNIHLNLAKVRKQRAKDAARQDTLRYDDNPVYAEQTGLFDLYKTKKARYVMLGSSFTQRVSWSELLGRNDVVNRGIGSDLTEGYLHRLSSVYDTEPEICFVETGANDLLQKKSLDTIIRQTAQLISNLHDRQIRVVLTKCFFAADQFKDHLYFNRRADSLNKRFDHLDTTVMLIDLNPLMNESGKRNKEYAIADGIHLSAAGYALWKQEIEKIINPPMPKQKHK